jgi:hypothetical protein
MDGPSGTGTITTFCVSFTTHNVLVIRLWYEKVSNTCHKTRYRTERCHVQRKFSIPSTMHRQQPCKAHIGHTLQELSKVTPGVLSDDIDAQVEV